MIPTEELIDKWGPLIIIAIAVYNLLPSLIKEVMNVMTTYAQSRATVAEAPYEMMKTMLSESTKSDLIAIELIGIRAKLESVEIAVNRLVKMFEEFIAKETKS